jgi:hypothetical protein
MDGWLLGDKVFYNKKLSKKPKHLTQRGKSLHKKV